MSLSNLLEKKEQQQIDSWINGVTYEVKFWNSFLRKKTRKKILDSFRNKDPFKLPLLSLENIGIDFENIGKYVVLDVGCGMTYSVMPYINGESIDLHYVDPLAVFYNDILKKRKLSLPEIEFAFVEYLSGFFDTGSANLIVIQNALDHSFDPVKGILECIRVLKVGGILYLRHTANEAERENYIGFHQYNINAHNGSLIIWNKDSRVDITKLLSDIAHIELTHNENLITAKIIKTSDNVSINDRYDKGLLSKQLLYTIYRFTKTGFVTKYLLRKKWQHFFHFASSIAPRSLKNHVKAIIRKSGST